MKEKLILDILKMTGKAQFSHKNWVHLLNPRLSPVLLYRISHQLYLWNFKILSKIMAICNTILFGCDIARAAKIEGGFYLPHPNGVVIGAHSMIGKNCIIHQGVTLGARGEEHELANPKLGHSIEIGTGAKILGGITLGNYSRVGANAVLLIDLPIGGIAVGLPAKIIGIRKDIQDLE